MLLYPLIRDQKAAGSNPATSTCGNLAISTVAGFFFVCHIVYIAYVDPLSTSCKGSTRGSKSEPSLSERNMITLPP